MNLTRTPTTTLYGSVAYGGTMSTSNIKAHLEDMLGPDRGESHHTDTEHPSDTTTLPDPGATIADGGAATPQIILWRSLFRSSSAEEGG